MPVLVVPEVLALLPADPPEEPALPGTMPDNCSSMSLSSSDWGAPPLAVEGGEPEVALGAGSEEG